MSRSEFIRWQAFYALFPFDDLHRYHRPAVLVASAMSGDTDTMRDRLQWLQPDPRTEGMSDADLNTFRAFAGAKVRPAPTKPATSAAKRKKE